MEDTNPKLIKNGGNGTVAGNILRGIIKVGKNVSPQLKAIIESVESIAGLNLVGDQIRLEDYTENEMAFLLQELEKDKQELIEITKRWESDNKSESWMAKNVRPWTLALYNIATVVMICLDSYEPIDFEVKSMWLNILLSNTGIVNTAYFGSRYLQKRDEIKYKI